MKLHWLAKVLAASVAALALGAVFLAYLNPHLAADLANRVWACL
jgi:hypothetical protein